MNNTVKTTLLAFLLGFSAFASAGHHSGATHEGTQVKHVGFSQMGDPATVLEVKTEASAALRPGDVRVKVLASPINPSDLLQIAGNYGVDPVLPARPGSEGIGRVTEVSADVQALKVGQLVLLASGSARSGAKGRATGSSCKWECVGGRTSRSGSRLSAAS